jgi:Outer membrane protein Omp28/Secretion system C-terminal sorting domain
MKKITIFLILFFTTWSLFSQTIVTTDKMYKNIVLEEYTGIHCGYCPDGHVIAHSIDTSNPGRACIIAIHQGSFAVPSGTEPDYRTVWGDALAAQTNLTGYPSGTVNRHVFSNLGLTSTGMGRGSWVSASNEILPQVSCLNIGAQSTIDTISRIFSIDVEVYYTDNSNSSTNMLNIALIENHVWGPQTSGSNPYEHMHMLRYLVTGQWGDTITNTTTGSLFQETYSDTLPAGWDLNNCEIVVFVAENHQEIITGIHTPLLNGNNNGTTSLYIGSVASLTDIDNKVASDTASFDMKFYSELSGSENFTFKLTSDAPANWTGNIMNGTTNFGDSTQISVTDSTSISIDIIPGATPFVATYTLSITSVSNPIAQAVIKDFFVISGVTDLVLNNNQGWGDGGNTVQASDFEDNYLNGLSYAGNTTYASTRSDVFIKASQASKLNGIGHIYFNIGWTFPAYTDVLVGEFSTFLDNGGRLMASGQDAGWDTWQNEGTATTKAFYTNYLHSSFDDDGGATNNLLVIETNDSVYYSIAALNTSAITNVYVGTNFYPDQISATATGNEAMYYNTTKTKTACVWGTNGIYKTVNFGISLEMIADTNVRKEVMKITHNFFHNIITGIEMQEKLNQLMGQNYPNPATNYTSINFSGNNNSMTFILTDINGRIIQNILIPANTQSIQLDISNLEKGVYIYYLKEENRIIDTKYLEKL